MLETMKKFKIDTEKSEALSSHSEELKEDFNINDQALNCKDAFDVIALFSPHSKVRYKMRYAIEMAENERSA
jgi:hypothetical protein